MPAIGPAVEVVGVTKWFGDVTALDRVSFSVARGTVHGLVGPNGAGKTTLLSVLFGLVRPDEGSVSLLARRGADRQWSGLDQIAGFVEAPQFYPYLTGRRNLVVLAGYDDGDSRDLVDEVIELVGLSAAANQKVKGYSLGMRQRLGVAAAIMRRPDLLILDEPTNGMDPAAIRDLGAALRDVAAAGRTVLLSSHDMNQVDALCDSVTVLDAGTAVFSGSVREIRDLAPDPAWRMTTSDDAGADHVAELLDGVRITPTPRGLEVMASQQRLDVFVISLANHGIAVRSLEQAATAVERMVQEFTAGRRPMRESVDAVDTTTAGAA